jgi:hypothetical protein
MHIQVANIRLCTYKSTQHKRETIAVGSISLSFQAYNQQVGPPPHQHRVKV